MSPLASVAQTNKCRISTVTALFLDLPLQLELFLHSYALIAYLIRDQQRRIATGRQLFFVHPICQALGILLFHFYQRGFTKNQSIPAASSFAERVPTVTP